MRDGGFCLKPNFSAIAKAFNLSPLARAVLEHLHEEAHYYSATYDGNSRRIAEEIGASRKKLVWAQACLKQCGLITYSQRFRPDTRPYFVSLKILDQAKDLDGKQVFVITRIWPEAVNEARAAGVIPPNSTSPSEALINLISRNKYRGRWHFHQSLTKVLTKEVHKLDLQSLVGAHGERHAAQVLAMPREETRSNNLAKIAEIGERFKEVQ